MKTLLRDLALFALVTLALLFGYVKLFGADKGSAAARVRVALALAVAAERERADDDGRVPPDGPAAKTCPCSPDCTCGCNDGRACRCGPPSYQTTPAPVPTGVLLRPGIVSQGSSAVAPRWGFPAPAGGWRGSAGSNCGPGG